MTAILASNPLVEELLADHRGIPNADALKGRPDLLQASVVEQLAEDVRQRVRVDVEQALRLAEAALAIAQALSDPEPLGRGFRAKGNALWFKGDCKGAVQLFQCAVDEFERAGREDELGRTLSTSIQPLLLLGEYDKALAAAARAQDIFQRAGDRSRLARLEINIANIHHRQDRFSEALASYERAYEELLPFKDTEALGVALHNMAVCLIMLNDFDRALACYQRARQLCVENGMPLLSAQADYNVAYLYFLRGDYQKAIELLRATRELCIRNGDAYHAALCDLDEAEICVELNLTEEAARLAGEAQHRFETLGMGFEEARSIMNLAIAAQQQNDAEAALELFAKAKSIFARERNEASQALCDLYQSMVLCESGRFDTALHLCSNALKFFEDAGLERRAVLCRLLVVRVSLHSGRIDEARESCKLVIERLEALKAPLLRYHACLFLGHIHRAAGESHAAYKAYGEARFYLESLRGSLQGEELKIAFLKNKLDVYENLVGLCLGRGSKTANEEAFHYMERAKSRSLADLLFGRAPQRSWQKSTSLQARRIRALREELNWFYHRIEVEEAQADKTSAHLIESLRTEASRCENHLLRALRELPPDAHGPGLLQAASAMPFDELCAALHSEATLLEYFQIGSQFLVAAVTRDGLKIVPLKDSPRIDASVRMLDFHWSKFRLRRRYLRTFEADLLAAANNHLHELYRVLIEPVISDLKGNHLIIVPHGALHRVPFHALSTGTEYLIDRFTISYAPSATIYAICERKGCRSAGGSLLLGVHDKNTPWIRREIQSVAAVVPGAQVFLGTQATMEVLTTRGPESRVIHVATHGFFRRDNPMFSCVRLADGYLSLYDLYGVNLPVELFTLSGCGTGLNVIAAGDEQMGLARGLLCAGAQSVLLTLWDVNDRTTAEFMASFYRHLQKQLQKPTALQAAMHEVRARYSHPYYWAPFVLLGKAFRTEA